MAKETKTEKVQEVAKPAKANTSKRYQFDADAYQREPSYGFKNRDGANVTVFEAPSANGVYSHKRKVEVRSEEHKRIADGMSTTFAELSERVWHYDAKPAYDQTRLKDVVKRVKEYLDESAGALSAMTDSLINACCRGSALTLSVNMYYSPLQCTVYDLYAPQDFSIKPLDGRTYFPSHYVEKVFELFDLKIESDKLRDFAGTDAALFWLADVVRRRLMSFTNRGVRTAEINVAKSMRQNVTELFRFLLHSQRVGVLDMVELVRILNDQVWRRSELVEVAKRSLADDFAYLAKIDWSQSTVLFEAVEAMFFLENVDPNHSTCEPLDHFRSVPW